jgi:hypothetical protein
MAEYPTSAATNAILGIAYNRLYTILTDNPLSAIATTVNVADTSGFPTSGWITINNGDDSEIISYTGTSATSFTGCTRAQDNTSAAEHPVNSIVSVNVIALHHNRLKDEVIAIETDLVNNPRAYTNLSNISPVTVTIEPNVTQSLDFGSLSKAWRTLFLKTSLILEQTSAGTNYVGLQGPSAVSSSYTLIFPNAQGGASTILQNDGSGILSWVSAPSGANTDLSNLASVAINTSLISDTDSTDDLGSAALPWASVYARTLLAGSSGKAGTFAVYPSTALRGRIIFAAADNAGDYTLNITNASLAAARIYTIPDAGANADFVMTEGTKTIDGVTNFRGDGSNNGLVVDANNFITQPAQPSFLVTAPANTQNVSGDGTTVTAEFDTEIFDLGGNFNTTTFTFTAPVTGKYLLNASILIAGVTAANADAFLVIVTSNRSYSVYSYDVPTATEFPLSLSHLCDMDANDTAYVTWSTAGTSKINELFGSTGGGDNYNQFSGSLIN